MIAPTIKAKILVFAIFFAGIGSGILIANFYTTRVMTAPDTTTTNPPGREQKVQRDINKFYDYLGLDQAQREKMHKIGEETRHEFQELQKETQPRSDAIREESRTKIRAVLNEEQRVKYDEFRHKMDERRKNRERDANKGLNKNDSNPGGDRGQRPN
jgi:Skp family chaperone for outer membrane proteins